MKIKATVLISFVIIINMLLKFGQYLTFIDETAKPYKIFAPPVFEPSKLFRHNAGFPLARETNRISTSDDQSALSINSEVLKTTRIFSFFSTRGSDSFGRIYAVGRSKYPRHPYKRARFCLFWLCQIHLFQQFNKFRLFTKRLKRRINFERN